MRKGGFKEPSATEKAREEEEEEQKEGEEEEKDKEKEEEEEDSSESETNASESEESGDDDAAKGGRAASLPKELKNRTVTLAEAVQLLRGYYKSKYPGNSEGATQ